MVRAARAGRGVHGLNGAVRAEVLTDRPEDRFVVGGVLYREGDDRPLTIASAEAVGRRPGLATPLPRGRDARCGRRPPRRLSRDGRPSRGRPGPRHVLLARGRSAATVRGVDGAELGTVKRHLSRRRDRGLRRSPAVRSPTSTCPRSARSSGSSRRGGARSWSTPSRSTCGHAKAPDPDRPKAPRRTGTQADPAR